MAEAYKCELSGELKEGKGIQNFLVKISPTCALLITPQHIIDETHSAQGQLSPESVKRVGEALEALRGPE